MTEVQLTWAATVHYRRLATVAMLPLLVAVGVGGPGYLAGRPMLAALALAARRPGFGVRIRGQLSAARCVEGEEITIRRPAEPGGPAGLLGARLSLPPALLTAGTVACAHGGTGVLDTDWRGTAQRWGRWNGQIVITVTSRGGLFTGTAAVSIPEITVFPRPPSLAQLVLPPTCAPGSVIMLTGARVRAWSSPGYGRSPRVTGCGGSTGQSRAAAVHCTSTSSRPNGPPRSLRSSTRSPTPDRRGTPRWTVRYAGRLVSPVPTRGPATGSGSSRWTRRCAGSSWHRVGAVLPHRRIRAGCPRHPELRIT